MKKLEEIHYEMAALSMTELKYLILLTSEKLENSLGINPLKIDVHAPVFRQRG
jgi:hypothetical protein